MAGIMVLLGGCATVGKLTNGALEMVGLKEPEVPEIPEIPDALKAPRTITIKLHAGANLNADANGQPLAVVARIYKLKQNAAFQQATYDVFLSPQKEKEVLGAELLEVKEITPDSRTTVCSHRKGNAGSLLHWCGGIVSLACRTPLAGCFPHH